MTLYFTTQHFKTNAILSQARHLKIQVSFFSLLGKISQTRSSTAHYLKISATKPEQWQETMWSLNTSQTVSVILVISVVMCWLPKAIYGYTDQGSIWTKSKTLIPLSNETFSYYEYNCDVWNSQNHWGGHIVLIRSISGSNDRNSLVKYILQDSVGFQCSLCGKTNNQKNNIMNHVESIHFPDTFIYQCHLCDKVVKTKSALNLHNSRNHSKKK